MYSRFFPPLLQLLLKLSFDAAMELSLTVSWVVHIVLVEIYIQVYLQPASKKQSTPAVGNVVAEVNGKKVT